VIISASYTGSKWQNWILNPFPFYSEQLKAQSVESNQFKPRFEPLMLIWQPHVTWHLWPSLFSKKSPKLKWSSHLSLPTSWDYRCAPPCQTLLWELNQTKHIQCPCNEHVNQFNLVSNVNVKSLLLEENFDNFINLHLPQSYLGYLSYFYLVRLKHSLVSLVRGRTLISYTESLSLLQTKGVL
jgi:hypothetical protein